MKKITFPFRRENSALFGKIYRPVAEVQFRSLRERSWKAVAVIVDTGADYTLLPHYMASILDVDLRRDCKAYPTSGIGGTEKVFLFREMPVKIGSWEKRIPVGFLNRDDVPPLLGRQGCLDKIGVIFHKRHTTFVLNT